MTSLCVAIDLGGTHLRVALVDGEGNIIRRASKVVGVRRDAESVVGQMISEARELSGEQWRDVIALGAGLPGFVDSALGVVHQSPHFPDWKEVPFKKLLEDRLKIPVAIDNDANCAALGEQWKGTAKDWRSFWAITLGTGIGGALVLDRRLWRGKSGLAGEVGHMVFESEGFPCACGGRGCWEVYASASAAKYYFKEPVELSKLSGVVENVSDYPKECPTPNRPFKNSIYFNAFEISGLDSRTPFGVGHQFSTTPLSGDSPFWKFFGNNLGIGMASLIHITGVTHFVIGGGLVGAWKYFSPAMQEAIQKRMYRSVANEVTVVPTILNGEAGVLGAASVALQGSFFQIDESRSKESS